MIEVATQDGIQLDTWYELNAGLSYKFKFESKPRSNDNVFEVDGIQLMVDPKSYEYLDGLTLDFKNTLMEQAFVFQNPNAAKSCGCGKSFLV